MWVRLTERRGDRLALLEPYLCPRAARRALFLDNRRLRPPGRGWRAGSYFRRVFGKRRAPGSLRPRSA